MLLFNGYIIPKRKVMGEARDKSQNPITYEKGKVESITRNSYNGESCKSKLKGCN